MTDCPPIPKETVATRAAFRADIKGCAIPRTPIQVSISHAMQRRRLDQPGTAYGLIILSHRAILFASVDILLRDSMSYDLAVFEPMAELRDRSTFVHWYESQTTWSAGLDYSNASNATDALQAWYRDMSTTFPPLVNASIQIDPDNRLWITEYAIAKDFVYAAFRWDKASMAYESVRRLAAKYAVGFFDVSGDRKAARRDR